ncbi:MAG: DUF6249 domain-containing protein, partial [Bacteroidota bacterium]
MAVEIIVPLSSFATLFGIIYIYYSTRHKERMAMIERCVEADRLFVRKRLNIRNSLKLGILGVGVALGILIGHLLSEVGRLPEPVAFFSMIFLFG